MGADYVKVFSTISQITSDNSEMPSIRKNVISIAGYPNWENVNSNLLAFYLDEDEEHGLSRLFITSLYDLIDEKVAEWDFDRTLYSSRYSVIREHSTRNGGRIDILIREGDNEYNDNDASCEWAVILENKVYSGIHNDLSDYWKSVKANSKVLVVMTIEPASHKLLRKTHSIRAVNITHKEMIDRVKVNLGDYYLNSDDRHLLLLKEYIQKVESYYPSTEEAKAMNDLLISFREHSVDIKELKRLDSILLRDISKCTFRVMEAGGFPPKTQTVKAVAKHFVLNPDRDQLPDYLQTNYDIAKRFRFYVDYGGLRYGDKLFACFELFGRDTKYGAELRDRLNDLGIFTDSVHKGKGGKVGGEYMHIYTIAIQVKVSENDDFQKTLEEAIGNAVFKHNNRFIETAVRELKSIIESEKS